MVLSAFTLLVAFAVLTLAPDALGAIFIPIATIGIGFAVVRATARRVRRGARDRAIGLARVFADFLEHRASDRDLHDAAAAADGPSFWTTLESMTVGLKRSEWRRLAAALKRIRHEDGERDALRDDSPWRRELAARRLALLPSRATRHALRRALDEGPELVTYAAALALGRARDARGLEWVLDHPKAFAKRTARARVELLRSFGRGAAPVLAEALQGGALDPAFERAAIEALGLARHGDSAPLVVRRLVSPDPEVRVAAARALGALARPECGAALMAALHDEAWPVRAQSARALGKLGMRDAVPQLRVCLRDPSWWTRRHAAYALRELGEEGRAALLAAARDPRDPYAREMAEEALASPYARPV